MADVLGTSVSLSKASLTFPNHLLIEDIRVYDPKNKSTIVQSPRLEIDLSLLSMLTCTIRPKKVRVMSPEIYISTSKKAYWEGIFPKIIPQSKSNESGDSTSWIQRLKPSAWPINMNPNHLEIKDAQAHIENEQGALPNVDGKFNLAISRSANPDKLALKSAEIYLLDVHIFHHGIQGMVTGNLKVDASNAFANMSLTLLNDEKVALELKVYDYQEQAKVSFELNTNSYDLKNLALIKYPLAQLSPTTNVTGLLTSSSPVLYGAPFQSFSASVIFNRGNWRVDAVSLKLLDDRGELRGSIIPDSAPKNTSAHILLFSIP